MGLNPPLLNNVKKNADLVAGGTPKTWLEVATSSTTILGGGCEGWIVGGQVARWRCIAGGGG